MSNNIQFFSEDVEFSLKDTKKTIQWITKVSSSSDKEIESINYIFCSDEYLLSINKEHLDHDYYTDIITFDLSEDKNIIESDIFISIDRVKENAITNNINFDTELYRVIIHGLLHLVGFNDKTEEQKIIMREKEDACLSLLSI